MSEEKNILQFDLSSKQIKYREILDRDFVELEVYAVSDIDPNRNGSHFTYESMKKAVENGSMKNKPIVGFLKTTISQHTKVRPDMILSWTRNTGTQSVEKEFSAGFANQTRSSLLKRTASIG